MRQAAEAVEAIFRGRPEIRAENEDYILGITETLAHLTDEELGWVTDPRNGVGSRCKYLPTPADVFELIREKRQWQAQLQPHTSWRKAPSLSGPWDAETDPERKRRVVAEKLGYNPERKAEPSRQTLPDDWSSANLKTPPKSPSRELRELLVRTA